MTSASIGVVVRLSLPHAIPESGRLPQAAMVAWDDHPTIFGDTAFQAGQIVGLLILVAIVIGLVRTFTRSDLTLREKILGTKTSDGE